MLNFQALIKNLQGQGGEQEKLRNWGKIEEFPAVRSGEALFYLEFLRVK